MRIDPHPSFTWAVASARQSTWNAAGPNGPQNLYCKHTETELKCFSHRRLLPKLQVQQEPTFQRGRKSHEASKRPIDAL